MKEQPNIELISIAEAARLTRLSKNTIKEMIDEGTIKRVRIRGYVYPKIRLSSLIDAVEKMEEE